MSGRMGGDFIASLAILDWRGGKDWALNPNF